MADANLWEKPRRVVCTFCHEYVVRACRTTSEAMHPEGCGWWPSEDDMEQEEYGYAQDGLD